MENNNQPAFPVHPYKELEMDIERGYPFGLTKREYFAGLAMQGLLSNSGWMKGYEGEKYLFPSDKVAEMAAKQADALLSALTPKPQ